MYSSKGLAWGFCFSWWHYTSEFLTPETEFLTLTFECLIHFAWDDEPSGTLSNGGVCPPPILKGCGPCSVWNSGSTPVAQFWSLSPKAVDRMFFHGWLSMSPIEIWFIHLGLTAPICQMRTRNFTASKITPRSNDQLLFDLTSSSTSRCFPGKVK